jgi:VWFA-related protein
MPAGPLRREDVRRTVVLFVDDLSMSSESVPAVRNGLRRFIEKQLQLGDLAAIVRASAGLGPVQDFTAERRLLLAAAGQIRRNPVGRGGAQTYRPMGMNPSEDMILGTTIGQEETISSVRNYTVAVASSLRRLLHGMADLPGRKSVVILSDDLPIRTPDDLEAFATQSVGSGMSGPIVAAMRRVVDESVRAGVVIYAIDTRGLNSLRGLAADSLKPPETDSKEGPQISGADWVWSALEGRRDQYREGQWRAMFLAAQTGGFMVTEANFIDAGIEQVMNDQTGYYLLAFTPPPEALTPGRDGKPLYHRLKVEVLRSGLRVRSHQGFFGVARRRCSPGTPARLCARIAV